MWKAYRRCAMAVLSVRFVTRLFALLAPGQRVFSCIACNISRKACLGLDRSVIQSKPVFRLWTKPESAGWRFRRKNKWTESKFLPSDKSNVYSSLPPFLSLLVILVLGKSTWKTTQTCLLSRRYWPSSPFVKEFFNMSTKEHYRQIPHDTPTFHFIQIRNIV